MKTREPRQYLSIDCLSPTPANPSALALAAAPSTSATGTANSGTQLPAFRVNVDTDLSDHVLAVGQRYQIEDVRCSVVSTLGDNTSGLLREYDLRSETIRSYSQHFIILPNHSVLGLNAGTRDAFHLAKSKLLRCYHVHGRLGTGTEDNFPHTCHTARSTFGHVYADKLGGLLASIQASHQQKMFELCGVDVQSQAAYELAAGGLIRPADSRQPLVYGLRCVHFERPNFTLEVHALNESEAYFGQLVQEIGIQLHTVAHCTGVRCVRHGHFDVDGALLRGSWTVQGCVDSLERNRRLVERYPEMLRQVDVRMGEAAASDRGGSEERVMGAN